MKNNSTREKLLTIHNKEAPTEKANELNNYFADIKPSLASNIKPSALNLDFNPVDGVPSFHFRETTEENIEKLLMAISDLKATGEDGIPITFLKMTKNISTRIVYHLINKSITTNIIPLE